MEKDLSYKSSFTEEIEDIKEKRKYELAVLLENESFELAVADFLAKRNVEVYQKDGPKTISLAYSIKKHNSGVLTIYCFSGLPELIVILKKELETLPNVLRFLLITPPINRVKKSSSKEAVRLSSVDIKPPRTETVTTEVLEETLEKILQ